MIELTAKERAAIAAIDMTEILGTPEERFRFAMDRAIQYFRERNTARTSAELAWEAHNRVLAENTRLRAFRDAIYAKIYEGAGTKGNSYAYLWQDVWDKIKAAEKGT